MQNNSTQATKSFVDKWNDNNRDNNGWNDDNTYKWKMLCCQIRESAELDKGEKR